MLQDDVKQELIDTSEQLIKTQAQRDRNAMKLEQLGQQQGAGPDGPAGSHEGNEEGEIGVLAGHLNRIASLEKEVKRLKQVCTMKTCYFSMRESQIIVELLLQPHLSHCVGVPTELLSEQCYRAACRVGCTQCSVWQGHVYTPPQQH